MGVGVLFSVRHLPNLNAIIYTLLSPAYYSFHLILEEVFKDSGQTEAEKQGLLGPAGVMISCMSLKLTAQASMASSMTEPLFWPWPHTSLQ